MNLFDDLHGFLPYQTWRGVLRDLRNRASCGLFSLHHAMVFLGQGGDYSIVRDNHPSLWAKIHAGTIAKDLTSLAKNLRLKAEEFQTKGIKSFRRHVDKALRAGSPVIIGSEPAVHWLCLGGRTHGGGYVWADSANGAAAVGAFDTWDEVEEWLTDGDTSALTEPFSAITVSPGKNMPASRSMVPWSGGVYESLNADADYAHDWSNLLADMLEVFWDREYVPKGVPAGEFLDHHLDGIVEATASLTWHDEAALRNLAHGYRHTADFHNLVVAKGCDAQAITAFAHKLAAKADASL
jgi:hypothetical protein